MTDTDFFNIETYDYKLPEELIAQKPVQPRDSCRLLVVDKISGTLEHRIFADLTDYLDPGSLLVRNDTRVMAARLEGVKVSGSAKCEILLLTPMPNSELAWQALVRPGRRLPPGSAVRLPDGTVVKICDILSTDGIRRVEFPEGTDVGAIEASCGEVPLPPYIHERTSQPEDYQTVYSRAPKSAAAPTAGLHFTKGLLSSIRAKGINIADITLEVGIGTFRPVKAHDIREHLMHTERCVIPVATYDAIKRTKAAGKRVIAVGTTVVRTLEGMAATASGLRPGCLETEIFIYPGFCFKVVDALITNFHLPKSTLMMLVSAFGGYRQIMKAYQTAVNERYRFFSFGDAMLIK